MAIGLISRIAKVVFRAPPPTPHQIRDLIQNGQHDQALVAADQLPAETLNREALVESLKGEAYFHARNDEEASAAFRRALKSQPDQPEAHYGLSLLMSEAGDIHHATKHVQFAVNMQPKVARFQAQLGYCHLLLGNILFAETALRKATRLAPENKYAWNNLGIVLRQKKSGTTALQCFKKALALDPAFERAQQNLDLAVGIQMEASAEVPLDEGPTIDELEAQFLLRPEEFECAQALMLAYEAEGDYQSGIDVLEAWMARHPGDPQVGRLLGLVWQKAAEPAKAERFLKAAAEHDPSDVEVLTALAMALAKLHRFPEAKVCLIQALELEPDNHELLSLHAANLANLCEYHESLEICERGAAEGRPMLCHAPVLAYLGKFDEAWHIFQKYMDIQPNEPSIRFLRASFQLLNGHFEQGWEDYKFRSIADAKDIRVLPFPEWNGEPLAGKRIVVLAEQGLGDQVMFLSCLKDLLALGPADIVVELIDRVAETVERSFPEVTVVRSKQNNDLSWLKDHPDLDYCVPLGDLPRFFRKKIEDFPVHQGYLRSAARKVEKWKKKIDEWEGVRGESGHRRPRIGVSWRGGSPTTRAIVRTFDVENLVQLAQGLDATWVCLQYGNVEADLARAKDQGLDMAYWPDAISDLDDFAAMMDGLDLIVTVCNTTVHYAGALNRPVWILSPHIPEWRYGLQWKHLPWYPSSVMFRQPALNDWQGLLERVKAELDGWIHARG